MPTTNCLNCGYVFDGNYCPDCGQKATVSKLTWGSVFEEFIHFFTHAEHNFVHTSKRLITEPGLVIREFLEGKRKRIHKPVTLLLIWSAIENLLRIGYQYLTTRYSLYSFPKSAPVLRILWAGAKNEKIFTYQNWISLLIHAPILVLIGWIIFRKTQTSFVERWVAIIYGISAISMVSAFMYTLTFLLRLVHAPLTTGMLNDGYFIGYLAAISWITFSFLKVFRPETPMANKISAAFAAALLANYAVDMIIYLLFRFTAH